MTQKIFITTLLGALVVGGGIWFFSADSDNQSVQEPATSTANTETATPETDENTEQTASMRALIDRGDALECTFTFTDQAGVTGSGTGYFASDERMRMESTVTQNDETYQANYVISDGTMYMWGDMQQGEFGIQVPVSPADTADPAVESDLPVAIDDEISFSCQDWNVDETLFSVPTNIEFMDMEAMMQGGPNMTPEQMESMQQPYVR